MESDIRHKYTCQFTKNKLCECLVLCTDYQKLPFLAAKTPPVVNPLMIEFHGSSFFRKCTNVQSIVLNIPPQTAKFPAITGDRSLTAVKLPT